MPAAVRGALLATLAFALVGSLVAASDTVESYPLAEGQLLRYLLAAGALLLLGRGRLPRLTLSQAASMAALAATGLVLFNVFVIAAVRETDPGTVGVIVGCVPVVLALAGPLFERRPVSRRVLLAAVVVSLGAAGVQATGGGITTAGLALAIGALVCEAAFSLFAAPHLNTLGPRAVSTFACLFALPMLAAWSLVTGPEFPTPDGDQLAALVYLGLAVTCGGFLSWYSAIGLLGIERAALFSGVLPISALACAAAIGVAELTPARLLAAAVVAAGITLGLSRTGPVPEPAPAR